VIRILAQERVLAALHHREPDRVPFDLGGTLVTGIHHIAYKNLLFYLGLKEKEIQIFDIIQQLAKINDGMFQNYYLRPKHHLIPAREFFTVNFQVIKAS
jgi:uroporphyrinogen decarboxylase